MRTSLYFVGFAAASMLGAGAVGFRLELFEQPCCDPGLRHAGGEHYGGPLGGEGGGEDAAEEPATTPCTPSGINVETFD